MRRSTKGSITVAVASLLVGIGCDQTNDPAPQVPAPMECDPTPDETRQPVLIQAEETLLEGQRVFRFETFGDEAFWGDMLRLHDAISGEALGGVGAGVSPAAALALGLKVDVDALPDAVVEQLKAGTIDLNAPATTLTLLQLNAVLGVTGFFGSPSTRSVADGNRLTSIGIQCAFCHSTVDDSLAPGIGRRLDGWPNRDLNVGAIVASSPNLGPFETLLGVDTETVRTVLMSWGPGKYDAELALDGRAFRPDGKSGATVLPPAFGLAGVNLHTYTGWGSVTYWNAFVANTQMHGQGTFYDPRLNDAVKFPVAARAGFGNVRTDNDLITAKLASLQFYQLALQPPKPAAGSFDMAASERGRVVFAGKAECATCHVPPLFTEPGWNMHTPEEIGIDDFQSSRSPDERYRTTPLGGLFTRMKGGFYHDGRFGTLQDVIAHYDNHFELALTAAEKLDLEEYLKSL